MFILAFQFKPFYFDISWFHQLYNLLCIILSLSMFTQPTSKDKQEVTTILFENIFILVKFGCRLYLEYNTGDETKRSQQIKIDPKAQKYRLDQKIKLTKDFMENQVRTNEQFNVYVKLLSNKGFAFTAGLFRIPIQQLVKKESTSFKVQISKSSEIQSFCQCKIIKINQQISAFKLMNVAMSQKTKKQQSTDQTKSVYFKSEPQSKRMSFQSISNFNFHQKCGIDNKVDKANIPYQLKFSDRKKVVEDVQEYKRREKVYQSRISQLQKQLQKNTSLFDKQKGIIAMFESKQIQMKEQHRQLRSMIRSHQCELEERRLRIKVLQNQKITFMMNNLANQKQMTNFREDVHQLIGKTLEEILKYAKLSICRINQQPKGNEQIKKQPVLQLQLLNKQNSNLQKAGVKYERFNQNDQSLIEGGNETLRQNISLELSTSFHDIVFSQVREKLQSILLSTDQQHNKKDIFKNYQKYFESIYRECAKIKRVACHYLQKMSKQNRNLKEDNRVFKMKLNQNKEKFENAEQSLIVYLEELEQNLEKELVLVDQKNKNIESLQQIIDDLTDKFQQKQAKIAELQMKIQKLQMENNQFKAEVNENNYIYSIKQQQFLKKIYQLENGFEMPHYQRNIRQSNIIMRRQVLKTQIDSSSDCMRRTGELLQYCERLRQKQLQLALQTKEKKKLLELIHIKESQLIEANNQIRKLKFAIDLKKRMSDFDDSLVKSYEQEVDLQGNNCDSVISQGMEEQFMQVLI